MGANSSNFYDVLCLNQLYLITCSEREEREEREKREEREEKKEKKETKEAKKVDEREEIVIPEWSKSGP